MSKDLYGYKNIEPSNLTRLFSGIPFLSEISFSTKPENKSLNLTFANIGSETLKKCFVEAFPNINASFSSETKNHSTAKNIAQEKDISYTISGSIELHESVIDSAVFQMQIKEGRRKFSELLISSIKSQYTDEQHNLIEKILGTSVITKKNEETKEPVETLIRLKSSNLATKGSDILNFLKDLVKNESALSHGYSGNFEVIRDKKEAVIGLRLNNTMAESLFNNIQNFIGYTERQNQIFF